MTRPRVWLGTPADQDLALALDPHLTTSFKLTEELARPSARVWLATSGERNPAGLLLAWEVADELQVLDVLTLPTHRRRGVAGALLDAAIDDARRARLRLVLLEVRRSNVAALGLYLSRGFATVATRRAYYADGEDALEMQLCLAPLDDTSPRPPTPKLSHGEMTVHSEGHHARTRKKQLVVPLLRRDSIGDVYHVLHFDVPAGIPASPGHFAMIRGSEWGESPLLPRPMSMLSGGTAPSVLIKVVGEGTLRMGRAEPGEPFTLLAPLGNTFRPVSAGKAPLLVAGGVGIAPLLFLARELSAQGLRPIAVYGGRTERDLPLIEELAEVAELHVATENGAVGTRGLVTDVLPRLLTPEVEVYTCGPDRMMARVAELARARGVACQASLETPMACGYGVCLGCPVPMVSGEYLYACTEGPCVDAALIDWNHPGHVARKSLGGRPR